MATRKKFALINEKGFALLAALIACLILMAIGLLVMNMSTGDLLTSAESVGQKKSLAAVESGITKIMIDFGPNYWTAANNYITDTNCRATNYVFLSSSFQTIPLGTDTKTKFAICLPKQSQNLAPLPASGFSLGGGGSSTVSYGYMRYDTTIAGKNESYNSQSKVDVGVGFGPVPIGGN